MLTAPLVKTVGEICRSWLLGSCQERHLGYDFSAYNILQTTDKFVLSVVGPFASKSEYTQPQCFSCDWFIWWAMTAEWCLCLNALYKHEVRGTGYLQPELLATRGGPLQTIQSLDHLSSTRWRLQGEPPRGRRPRRRP